MSVLDLLVNVKDAYESGSMSDHCIFTQPGMRYSISKALIYSLMEDESFSSNSEQDKNHVINKILEDVKGRMLEEIVLLETVKSANKNKKVFKFKFDNGGEYDMVVYDALSNSCSIYEVKHSDKQIENQTRYLMDEEKLKVISDRYGKIENRIVLYRGKTESKDNGISYLNVEEYLMNL